MDAATASDFESGLQDSLGRAARLVNQHALDPSLPGLAQVIDTLIRAVFERPTANAYEAEVAINRDQRTVTLATVSVPKVQFAGIPPAREQRIAARLAQAFTRWQVKLPLDERILLTSSIALRASSIPNPYHSPFLPWYRCNPQRRCQPIHITASSNWRRPRRWCASSGVPSNSLETWS